MLHATIQVLLYGLLAGLSPLAFAAAIAVTQTGRLKAVGFGAGFVLAQLFTCAVFVIAGVAVTGTTNSYPGIQALLGGTLAVLLVSVALQVRRRGPRKREGSSERTRALLERLGRLRFLTTILAGLVLGIGGPKRLVLTAFAATTITAAGTRNSGEVALVLLYVALATVLVWGPVILFVLLGERAVALMTRAQAEVERRQPEVTVYALLLLATILAIDAVAALLFQVF